MLASTLSPRWRIFTPSSWPWNSVRIHMTLKCHRNTPPCVSQLKDGAMRFPRGFVISRSWHSRHGLTQDVQSVPKCLSGMPIGFGSNAERTVVRCSGLNPPRRFARKTMLLQSSLGVFQSQEGRTTAVLLATPPMSRLRTKQTLVYFRQPIVPVGGGLGLSDAFSVRDDEVKSTPSSAQMGSCTNDLWAEACLKYLCYNTCM